MMGFDYTIYYRKGVTNKAVDALSRRLEGHLHMITTLHYDLLDRIKGTWSHDPNLVDLIHKLQQPTNKPSKFTWANGQLPRKGKLVVGSNDSLRKELLNLFHSFVRGGT